MGDVLVVVVVVQMIEETRVSVHAHTYVQWIQRQHWNQCCTWLKASETFPYNNRSLVTDRLINQPQCEEKGKVAGHPHPQ